MIIRALCYHTDDACPTRLAREAAREALEVFAESFNQARRGEGEA
jgi:hypothetical protein